MKHCLWLLLALGFAVSADPIDVQITRSGQTITHHAQTHHTKAKKNAPAASVDGTLEALHMDYTDGHSEWHYYVRKADNTEVQLNIDALPIGEGETLIKPRSKVHVTGKKGTEPSEVDPATIDVVAEPQALAATTTTKALFVPVYFSDQAQPASQTSNMTATAAQVAAFYAEDSLGAETMQTTVWPNWIKLTAKNNGACNWSAIDGDSALTAAGIVKGNYQYVQYQIPSSSCGWLGLGYVGYGRSFIQASMSRQVWSHELGHNHGLLHAGNNNGAEYGDAYSTMGNNQTSGHFTAYQKTRTSPVHLDVAKVGTYVIGSGTRTFDLTPIETPNGPLYAIKVATNNTHRTYYVMAREKVGFDAANLGGPLIQIHTIAPFETSYGSDDTHLVKSLGPDQQFVDDQVGLMVTFGSPGLTTTSTVVSGVPNPAYLGQGVSYTATVTSTRTVTGTVTFADSGTVICSNVVVSSNAALCAVSNPVVGTHSVVATYNGDTNNQSSTSTAYIQTVSSGTPPSQFINGGFEIPFTGGYIYNPAVAGQGWVFTGTSGVQRNSSQFSAPTAPEGSQTGVIQNGGSISQTITLQSGSYTLAFSVANRGRAVGAPNNPVIVTLDGAQIGPKVIPSSASSWDAIKIPFTISVSGAHTFMLSGTTTTQNADVTTFVDALSLQ